MSILRRRTRHELVAVVPATVVTIIGAGLTLANPALGVAFMASQPLLDLAAQSLTRVSDVAVEESGLTAGELAGRLSSSDEAIRLLARTIQVAGTGGQDERLRVLGRCLANAATDGARIDEDLLLVAAIGAIEPPHLRLLSVLAQAHRREIGDGKLGGAVQQWSKDDPQTVDSSLSPLVVLTVVGLLIAHGLVAALSGYGSLTYEVTPLGHLLLERARETES